MHLLAFFGFPEKNEYPELYDSKLYPNFRLSFPKYKKVAQ